MNLIKLPAVTLISPTELPKKIARKVALEESEKIMFSIGEVVDGAASFCYL